MCRTNFPRMGTFDVVMNVNLKKFSVKINQIQHPCWKLTSTKAIRKRSKEADVHAWLRFRHKSESERHQSLKRH